MVNFFSYFIFLVTYPAKKWHAFLLSWAICGLPVKMSYWISIMYITPYYFRKVYKILLEMDDSQVDTRWTIPDIMDSMDNSWWFKKHRGLEPEIAMFFTHINSLKKSWYFSTLTLEPEISWTLLITIEAPEASLQTWSTELRTWEVRHHQAWEVQTRWAKWEGLGHTKVGSGDQLGEFGVLFMGKYGKW